MDCMHEGLLILSDATDKDPQQFMFCNRPAQKLIRRYLGSIDDCHDAEKALYTQTRIIKK